MKSIVALLLAAFVIRVPVLDPLQQPVGRLVYTAKTFDTEDECKAYLQTDTFKATLPVAADAVKQDDPDNTVGEPYCDAAE